MSSRNTSSLRGDIFGGLTAAVVALPLAIAFGVAAFAPLGVEYTSTGALVGLLGAIFTGLFASWLGGTPAQVTGPTGPMTVVSTAVIAAVVQAHGGDIGTIMVLLALTIVVGGVFQIALGIFGAGSIVKYIPYPVVAGFMNGIAIIIFLSQVKPFFGMTGDWSNFTLDNAMVPITVGAVTILAMLISGRLSKTIPGALVGLVAGIATYLGLAASGIAPFTTLDNTLLVGTVPNPFGSLEQMQTMMPVFNFSSLANITSADLHQVIVGGLALGILGSIDSLLTSVVADKVTKTRHNSRKELIGQGIGNIVSGLGGGLAGAGATVRTLVNINAGGRSRRSGMLHSVALITVVVALGVPAGWIPLSALAGILFVTAVSMIDRYSLALVKRKLVWHEVGVMAAVAAVTVSVDLMVAVGVGCGIALLLFVWKQIKVPFIRRKLRGDQVFSRRVRRPERMEVLRKHGSRTLAYQLSGSLFFGTANTFSTAVEEDLETADRFIFDFSKATDVDLSGIQILLEIVDHLRDNNRLVYLSGLLRMEQDHPGVHDVLYQLDVINKVGEDCIFTTLDRALEAMERQVLAVYEHECADDHETGSVDQNVVVESKEAHALSNLADSFEGMLEQRELSAGEWLFHAGDPAEKLAIVRTGRLALIKQTPKGEMRVASIGPGATVNIRTLFNDTLVNNSVFAEEPTTVYLMSREALTRSFEHNPVAVAALFRDMLQGTLRRLDVLTGELSLAEAH